MKRNMNIKEKIWKEIDNKKSTIIKLASDLIKIPSENPPGDMSQISSFIIDHLKSYGLKYEIYEIEKGRINIICKLGSLNKPLLMLNGHMDVVPAGDSSRWSFPPYSGEIKNGFILGRGASDMKGGLAGIIATMEFLAESNINLPGSLVLVIVPDEETGSYYGNEWIMKQKIFKPTACIIAEPTSIDSIDVGQRGALWIRITVKGKPIHGSLSPYLGDNAIMKSFDICKKVLKLTEIKSTPPFDIKETIDFSQAFIEKLIGFKNIGKILISPSVNIGMINGGTKINMVPDKCNIDVDIRLPIGLSVEQVKKELISFLKEYEKDIELNVITAMEPNYTSPKENIVKCLYKNIKEVTSIDPKIFVQWASSDARFFRYAGIPTIHYGPSIIEGIHGYDEKVKAEDVIIATKVYIGTVIDFFKSNFE
ncbi:MAG: ArgE/DapE family deacylase [Nitrososphaerota archaeon]